RVLLPEIAGSVRFEQFRSLGIGDREADAVYARLLVGHARDVLAALPAAERATCTVDEFLAREDARALLGVPDGFLARAARLRTADGDVLGGSLLLGKMSLADAIAEVERGGELALVDPKQPLPAAYHAVMDRPYDRLDAKGRARLLAVKAHARLLVERAAPGEGPRGPFTSIVTGKQHDSFGALMHEYHNLDFMRAEFAFQPLTERPELVDVVARMLKWAATGTYYPAAADISATVDAIGLATARHVIVERERGIDARLKAEARAERGIAFANQFDDPKGITDALVVATGYVDKKSFIDAIRAGTLDLSEIKGNVLGKIKEFFAEKRLRSIANTLNKLSVNHRERMYDLAGKYFLDRTYVVEALRGKNFIWDVLKPEGQATTIDYRIVARPPGTVDPDNVILSIPHEQKAHQTDSLKSAAKGIVEQMFKQFVREVGQLRRLIGHDRRGKPIYSWRTMSSIEIEERVGRQFVRFFDIVKDEAELTAEQVRTMQSGGYEFLREYLTKLKNSDQNTYNRIKFPAGTPSIIESIMKFAKTFDKVLGAYVPDPITITQSKARGPPIATVSDVQVSYEKTNPSSGQYAWVVRFNLTPANPAGSKAIPVRLIVGWHVTSWTRTQYENKLFDVLRGWCDEANIPYPAGL
ncbi:MAG: hypothetical protein Q6370_025455, partial [Candidatus Sigynarchaeota archaeon]